MPENHRLPMEDLSAKIPQNSSTAEAVLGSEDLFTEIFNRLHPKHMVRLKTLSKHWYSHLSLPKSINLDPKQISPIGFLFASQVLKHLIFCHISPKTTPLDATSPYFLQSIKFLERFGVVNVISSSNVVFLCRFVAGYRFRHVVLNPAYKGFSMVPEVPENNLTDNPVFVLSFNPLESPYYKMVCFRDSYMYDDKKMKTPRGLEIFVYSSETRTWKLLDFQDFGLCAKSMTHCVSWNGAILAKHGRNEISYFDFSKEELSRFPSPATETKHTLAYVGEWCGKLLSVVMVDYSESDHLEVFEWDKDDSKWLKKHCIDVSKMSSRLPGEMEKEKGKPVFTYRIVGVICGEREIDDALVFAGPESVTSYNFILETAEVFHKTKHIRALQAFPLYV